MFDISLRLWIAGTAFWVGVMTTPAWADPSFQSVAAKGVICDTLVDVKAHIDYVSKPQEVRGPYNISGCGSVRGVNRVTVTPLEMYETETVKVLLAKIEAKSFGTQYGWIAFEMKEPEPEEVEA